jgi:hypothetical protein
MIITNDNDMMNALLNISSDAINEVGDYFLKLLKSNIIKIVYGAGRPTTYLRNGDNGGILGNWYKGAVKRAGNTVEMTIDEEPELMIHDPSMYIHGSKVWYTDDIRDILAEIIIEGESGPLFSKGEDADWWQMPRDFWTPTFEESEDDVSTRFIRSFKKQGIVLVRN